MQTNSNIDVVCPDLTNKQLTSDCKLVKIKQSFASQGYEILENEYKSSATKMHFRCPKGHLHQMSWDRWKIGIRCTFCTRKTISIDTITLAFASERYTLLSTSYTNARTKLQYRCPQGHAGVTEWKLWSSGHRCWLCANQQSKQYKTLLTEQVRSEFLVEGYLLEPSTLYTSQHQELTCKCLNGHSVVLSRVQWTSGTRCNICSEERNRKEAYQKHQSFVILCEQEGYKVVSTETTGAHGKIDYICPKGHSHSISRVNWTQGVRCPSCTTTTSRAELEILEYYQTFNPIPKSRQVIAPKELDLYFEDHKLAIEYCGLYWHSSANPYSAHTPYGKSSYHYEKMKECNEKGIRLITIFEDEWLNHKELCKSRIDAALGYNQDRLAARKCELKEVSIAIACDFLNLNHLQQAPKQSRQLIAYGLYHNDKLLSVMTLGLPSRSHVGQKILELKRFASLPNTIVVGGASKLFKKAVEYARQNNYEEIRSYCDMRWGTGNVYQKLGFILKSQTKYTPHYTDIKRRWRNQTFACRNGKTEKQLVAEKGLYKIYDCGHQTWTYHV